MSGNGNQENGPSNIQEPNVSLWEDIFLDEDGEEYFEPADDSVRGSKRDYGLSGPWDTPKQYIPGTGMTRYNSALKNLIPVRRKCVKENKSLGIDDAGLWSFITIKWLTKFFYLAYNKGLLKVDDIPNPSPFDTCEYNVQRLETIWNEEVARKGTQSASLGYATWRFVKTRVIVSSLLLIVQILMGFISIAYFTRYLLEFTESKDATIWVGIKWTLLLTLTELLRVTLYSIVWTINYRTGLRLRSAFLSMLYRKVLRVYCLENKSVGELVNMFANDGQRIYDLLVFTPMIVGGPVSLLLGMAYVFWILGPWALFGLSSMFLFYPLQYGFSHLSGYLKQKALKITDVRIMTISEMLANMKFVKFYSWVDVFKKKIQGIRKKELNLLEKVSYCQSLSSSLSLIAPIISSVSTFLIHILVEGHITASQAFPVMSLLTTQLRLTLTYFQFGYSNIIQILITFERLKTVLLLSESTTYLSRPVDKSQALCIANGYFACYVNQPNTVNKPKKMKNGANKTEDIASELENRTALLKQATSPRYQNILFDINFYASKGKLIGLCGPVGSGKTSLISAILGQIRMTEGKLCREGTCAYVSQQAWLMNATLKENILFGEKFNPKRYFAVLHYCALDKDIDMLPGADETEIGEKGINLSGGQKQRVALARALYSNRDIYLLDDPLSAVDTQIAVHIFEKCILQALATKTVIFVSHKIEFLSRCDEIVLMKEGRIIERGNHNDLISKNTDYKMIVETYANQQSMAIEDNQTVIKDKSKSSTHIEENNKVKGPAAVKSLIVNEKTEQGAIQCHTFLNYMKASGGMIISFTVILIMLLNVGSTAFSSWWLALWIKAGSGETGNISNLTKLTIGDNLDMTGNLTDLNVIGNKTLDTLENNTLSELSDFANKSLDVFENLSLSDSGNLSLAEEFDSFDNSTLSEGNFTSFKEVFVEGSLADNPDFGFYQLVYCLCIVAVFVTSLLRGYIMTKVSLNASSNIHNMLMNKILKAKMIFFETTPIGRYQNLFAKDIDEVETRLPPAIESLLQGIWQIAFALLFICMAFPLFIVPLILIAFVYYFINRKFRVGLRELKRLDNTTRSPIFSNITCTISGLDTIHAFAKEKAFLQKFITSFDLNATCMFMNSISNRWLALRLDAIAVFITFVTSVLIIITHGVIPPALAGLALAYAASLSGLFQYTVRIVTETEVRFLSVERIDTCIKTLEQEGGHGPKGIPTDLWPVQGSVAFRNVKLRYRPGLPFALNDISFFIQPSEKIGIVGRTGSGKSSLISALFRLVDINEGSITIDNLDITTIDLAVLRGRLALIPQDPVLFSGTIRSNLDPTGIHKDSEIWDALERVKVKDRIALNDGKLDSAVACGGDNLSCGEIQQLCLARALLKQTKVMVFDEATAALDLDTESIVFNTIFNSLKDCTVLLIAHRLETVKLCNRILVIDNGKVAEFDEPSVLLQNQNSLFYKMSMSKLNQKS